MAVTKSDYVSRPEDVPPCASVSANGVVELCNDRSGVRVQGYDGKWRCDLHARIFNEQMWSDVQGPENWYQPGVTDKREV